MRFWGPNIQISGDWVIDSPDRNNDNARKNPNAEKFEKDTQDLLRDYISRNDVGKIVLDALNTPHPHSRISHSVTIRPLTPNAVGKTHTGPTYADRALELDIGSPNEEGPGSDATIWFYTGGVSVKGHYYRSDDSLLHECFHALRQVRGRWRAVPLPGFDNREELFAVMVTNIFASRGGRNSDMRSSHASAFAPMQLTADQFQGKFYNEILNFRTLMGDIHSSIAGLKKIDWNPLEVFEERFWWGR